MDFNALKNEMANDSHALHEEISNAIMSEILGLQQRFAQMVR
jgi:hypothetical protein